MVILGNIIKSLLEIVDTVAPETSPVKNQEEMLIKLLEKAKNTSFGKFYSFDKILKEKNPGKAFSETVPYFDYHTMHNKWWQRQMDGESDVTWPGLPAYYAMSAGTTEKSNKRIPVTSQMLDAIRQTSINQILSLSNFNLPASFFEKEIMMLGSSTRLTHKGIYEEGEISGISAKNIPPWFERFYRPGKEISSITDWDQRVEAIAREASKWDIGAMAGIPSWNELMLKRVIEYNKAETIHDIWPNLRVFASGGVAFSPYKKSFESLTATPLTFIDTYLASEGFIAYQNRPSKEMAMALSSSSGLYFEFIPFIPENIDDSGNVKQGVKSLSLTEIETGIDYILILSSVAGAWRYMIGDTIRFTNKERAEIVISGRTRHFLNVVGSQLSIIQMNAAMHLLEEKFHLQIPEFTVAAIRENNESIHHWYLGIKGEADNNEIISTLDRYLSEINKSYKMAREQALKEIKVTTVSPEVFYAWNEQEQQKGGQVKMPRVMNEEVFLKWKNFAANFNQI